MITYGVEIRDGIVHAIYTAAQVDKPKTIRYGFRIEGASTEGLLRKLGAEWRNNQWHLRYKQGDQVQIVPFPSSDQQAPAFTEEEDIEPPTVRKSTPIRWEQGKWEKKMAKGWVKA